MFDPTINILKIFTLGTLGFLVSFFSTPILTHFLFKYKFWKKKVREKALDGEEMPVSKKFYSKGGYRLPRGGGTLIWLTVLFLSLLFFMLAKTDIPFFKKLNFLSRDQTWLPLFALAAGSIIGLIDDFLVVRGLPSQIFQRKIWEDKGGGIKLRYRLFLIFLIGAIGAYWFYFKLDGRTIHIPGNGEIYLGLAYIPLFIVVNMAVYSSGVIDGLDGLSGGVFATIFAAYGVIALWQGQVNLAAFCATILGSLLSFLWFNIPPSRFVMGETGMLGITSALTVIVFLTNSVLVLPVIGLLLVIESGSVIIQLVSKRFRGKKVFLAAPIHHHFQAKGWPHYKVTMRFWIISVVASLIGVAIRLLG